MSSWDDYELVLAVLLKVKAHLTMEPRDEVLIAKYDLTEQVQRRLALGAKFETEILGRIRWDDDFFVHRCQPIPAPTPIIRSSASTKISKRIKPMICTTNSGAPNCVAAIRMMYQTMNRSSRSTRSCISVMIISATYGLAFGSCRASRRSSRTSLSASRASRAASR